MSNYRIVVSCSEEKKVFVARAPELDGCEVEGETRAAAVAGLEEEMTAQLENIREQGAEPPPPLDLEEFDGQLTLKLTPQLHRDLVFMARASRVDLELLLTELLTRGVSSRGPVSRGGRPPQQDGNRRGRDGREGGERYHDIMENRADFIEYVRRLEGGGTGGRGRGPRGRGR